MKLLTTNFLTCAVKACKSSSASFPLHFKDAVLERTEIDFNPLFIKNILPRVNWDALTITATELGLQAMVPEKNPTDLGDNNDDETAATKQEDDDHEMDVEQDRETDTAQKEVEIDEDVLKKLHTLLLETAVSEGKLVCGNCGFEYPIKEGVGNFLLPAHLV
ncbi:TRM112-like protein [Fonsecaea pedrosoi]|nr:TRM112-like protein [Fonsecaea pedrosoi]